MTELHVTTTSGTSLVLDAATVQGFKTSLRGPLLHPRDAGYDDARKIWRLLLDSRVVIGQFLCNSLFLQAFHEGRDRCGIFGKSLLISSIYVLFMLCKTPESNKSLNSLCGEVAGYRAKHNGARAAVGRCGGYGHRGAGHRADGGPLPEGVCGRCTVLIPQTTRD